MATTSYLLGLGSNRPHGRHGRPAQVLAAALRRLGRCGLTVEAATVPRRSAALGPSGRDYANAAALVRVASDPPALLETIKAIEREFGRGRGRRWGARVLDIDILAWSGGAWPPRPRVATGPLIVPHAALAFRPFAIGPAAALAPHWRDPRSGRTLRQLAGRQLAARCGRPAIDRAAPRA